MPARLQHDVSLDEALETHFLLTVSPPHLHWRTRQMHRTLTCFYSRSKHIFITGYLEINTSGEYIMNLMFNPDIGINSIN